MKKSNLLFATETQLRAVLFFVFFVSFRFSVISQNIGINTDGAAAETGVMLDIKEPTAKTTTAAVQTFFQLKSFDADASALKLRLGFKTDAAQANRYGFMEFLEAGTPTYLNLALQPSGGNVGIRTTAPNTVLDINGSFAFRQGTALALVNGTNSDIAIGAYSFFRITGPTAAFTITGLTGGVDGRIVTLYNTTAQAMTIANNITSAAANQILTLTGANITTPAGPNAVQLQYNSTSARWIMIGGQNTAASGGGSGWLLTGNAGLVDATNFLGTTAAAGDKPLNFRVNNEKAGRIEDSNTAGNVFFGYWAGKSSAVGGMNTAIGSSALNSTTGGIGNTAIGVQSLWSNVNGDRNVAVGWNALYSTVGSDNTGIGMRALASNTVCCNTAIGKEALWSNTSGTPNIAMGYRALYSNITTSSNIAVGNSALYTNATANNVAVGHSALYSNTSGDANIAMGNSAMFFNTTGRRNVAIGDGALTGVSTLSTGDENVAIGRLTMWQATSGYANTGVGLQALSWISTGFNNTGVGRSALSSVSTGDNNTAIGYMADVSFNLTNSTAIGSNASVTASNKGRFGDVNVNPVETQTAWTTVSDGRFKFNVKEEVAGLDFIKKLRPVMYQFDTKKFDAFLMQNNPDSIKNLRLRDTDYSASTNIIHAGFIAQEVQQAAKQCGFNAQNIVFAPQNNHDNYSMNYAAVVVPLVKAVQEQQEMIEDLQTENKSLQLIINCLKAENETLSKKMEKIESALNLTGTQKLISIK